ncbi:hypothetical protein [Alteromonas sp. H39]|uniref:hypothetical protein n=1 Tax=Alteromonas sp. H39 TaxID=3389876 RepID=UPI0039E082E5
MAFCQKAVRVNNPDAVMPVLKALAKSVFHCSRPVPLQYGYYAIDGKANNVRALVMGERATAIRFCCRYQHDVPVVENMVVAFVKSHGEVCELTDWIDRDCQ